MVYLKLHYEGNFNQQLASLYKVTVDQESYAFSQFEAIDARSCFPSFDEPRFKTPFELSIKAYKKDYVATNTPVAKKTDISPQQVLWQFKKTAPLPTYLIAVAVGPFDVVQGPLLSPSSFGSRAVSFQGLATKGQGKKLHYALNHTADLVNYLENYFGIAYPYEKLDIVAVPDFAAGAMENAGLITFREPYLLIDEDNITLQQIEDFRDVMTHELAHQWFGNLVTMPWWDDLWLNEAFATWMTSHVRTALDPYPTSRLGLLSESHDAMAIDSTQAARTIRQSIGSNHDIYNAFDALTYRKGAWVIGMFEQFLGATNFQKAIQGHLQEHFNKNASTIDFFNSLEKYTAKNVNKAITSFIEQPGVPLLKITPQCEKSTTVLDVVIQRYAPVGASFGVYPNRLWQIPFCFRYEVDGTIYDACEMLEQHEVIVPLKNGCPTWLMPNNNGAGYYRFELPIEYFKAIVDSWQKLTAAEHVALVDSIRAAFKSGTLTLTETNQFLDTLAQIPTRQAVEKILRHKEWIYDYLWTQPQKTAALPSLQKWAKAQTTAVYSFTQETLPEGEKKLLLKEWQLFRTTILKQREERSYLQKQALHWLWRNQVAGITKPSSAAMSDSVDMDTLETALTIFLEDAPTTFLRQKNLDSVLQFLKQTTDGQLRSYLVLALGAADLNAQKKGYTDFLLGDLFRLNEIRMFFRAHTERPTFLKEFWTWFTSHYTELAAKLPDTYVGRLPNIFQGFCSESDAAKVEQYFTPLIEKAVGGPRNLATTVETIRLCASLRAKHHVQ